MRWGSSCLLQRSEISLRCSTLLKSPGFNQPLHNPCSGQTRTWSPSASVWLNQVSRAGGNTVQGRHWAGAFRTPGATVQGRPWTGGWHSLGIPLLLLHTWLWELNTLDRGGPTLGPPIHIVKPSNTPSSSPPQQAPASPVPPPLHSLIHTTGGGPATTQSLLMLSLWTVISFSGGVPSPSQRQP